MPNAILQCTEAAGAEFEASLQKSLLRVRLFGCIGLAFYHNHYIDVNAT